jgi:hypothetical protein
MFDTQRDLYNPVDSYLVPNVNVAETVDTVYDFHFNANGFKIASSQNSMNQNNLIHIGIAFAEQPFKYSNAR